MSYPIHILKHEHRVIEQGLRALNGVCLRLASGQWIPPGTLSQLLDFIRTFADQYHHGKEEAHFFPALERRGVQRDDGPLGMLAHQHEIERELSAQLCLAIEDYAGAYPKPHERFIAAARRYIDLSFSFCPRSISKSTPKPLALSASLMRATSISQGTSKTR